MMLEPKTLLFYIFSAILVIAALRVITARNPVHAALFLVLSFFTAAGIWMLLHAEFLAILLVLVYVGAVMVLFLFVVMMLDLDLDHMRKGFKQFMPVASLVGAVIVAEMSIVLIRGFIGTAQPVQALSPEVAANNTKALGTLLYTEYLFSFEVAGVILLVAIIASVALTLRRRKDTKTQDIAEQIRTRKEDRVRMVSTMNADTTATKD
ncbi:MAG: NADH-quinone oxidoreductase subunit J [Polynucleobacter victoriensis]|jgi:NADH-quinone oxidoreductase subunit J|uniref:NADH-quinone oxidoreductase subunit J n=1 Tax=Polynucleobacter victoriensis TaxID=2049319 RepID=A0A212U2T8_9BURK|nr:NADH-quinone oxidoreductase subunit J [Polynucleobacter victoriensis]SNC72431.1 NADH-quinone oxidoreductase subunit J [Polynucleobacter victoriensis]